MMQPRLAFLAALVAGTMSAFAFLPVGWWPLMVLAISALCELIARAGSLRQALLVGWGFGLGQFVIGLNWIATAFTYQAAMPAWLGWIAVVLLSLYLAVYPMLAAGLAWRFGKANRLALVLALAGAWAITEWLRGTMFTGFAWNPIGVTLVDTPWIHFSAFIGTYGLSALVVVLGSLIWLLAHRSWRSALALSICAVVALTGIQLRPQQPLGEWAERPVRIVQPNIGQQDKWQKGFEAEAARRLTVLSMKPGPRPRLLLWPEAAITDPVEDERSGQAPFAFAERAQAATSLQSGEYLLTGGIGIVSDDGVGVSGAANGIYVIEPRGVLAGRYVKAHLVPYGEYLPIRPLLSAIGLSRLAPGDIDFVAGPGPQTIQLPDDWGKVGFQLCYEIIFSGEVVDRNNRPGFIFNPSNDAWFGRWGPPQHLAQAQLRAAEEGLPVIRSTPTGISALIDPYGEVVRSLPWKTAGFIDANLPPATPPTLFARLGNIIPLALGFLLLIAAIALDSRRRYRRT